MKRLLLLLPLLVTTAVWSGDAPSTRDPWLWPFASDSIWNMPIGDGAIYHGTGHFVAEGAIGADIEFHYKTSAQAPLRNLHVPEGWPVIDGRHGKLLREWRIDDDVVVRTQVSNNCAAFLMPDGRTLEQLEPFIRMERGGILLGYPNPFQGGIDLHGPGIIGTHWGSGLSAFGGSLRHGELTGDQPIRHVLKLNVFCKRYLHFDRTSSTPGWRWPATNPDGYAGDQTNDGHYQGSDPRVVQGALLAIAPTHTAASLGLKTRPARRILQALQDYGAYIVDDTGSESYHLCPSREAAGEFLEVYGHPIDTDARATGAAKDWHDDLMKLVPLLAVVDNNRADNVGGGGRRRAALAPPLGDIDRMPPSVPTGVLVTATGPTSVTLTWNASRDDVRICGYQVFDRNLPAPVAETFGRTTVTITGLKPATTYHLTVIAYDTGLNRSLPSMTVKATTTAVVAGTILEDFDDGVADGWTLDGAAVRDRRLELAKWDGDTRAISGAPDLPAAFTYTARLATVGGAAANAGRILLRHRDDQTSCWIAFAGGQGSAITLEQTLAGEHRVLATANTWLADRFSITCESDGRITLVLTHDGVARTVFERVATTVPAGGRLGFTSRFNMVTVDDVQVLPIAKP